MGQFAFKRTMQMDHFVADLFAHSIAILGAWVIAASSVAMAFIMGTTIIMDIGMLLICPSLKMVIAVNN